MLLRAHAHSRALTPGGVGVVAHGRYLASVASLKDAKAGVMHLAQILGYDTTHMHTRTRARGWRAVDAACQQTPLSPPPPRSFTQEQLEKWLQSRRSSGAHADDSPRGDAGEDVSSRSAKGGGAHKARARAAWPANVPGFLLLTGGGARSSSAGANS